MICYKCGHGITVHSDDGCRFRTYYGNEDDHGTRCTCKENANEPPDIEALRARLTATEQALEAARGLIVYRDANTLNFQLEKADDFLRPIRAALSRLAETRGE